MPTSATGSPSASPGPQAAGHATTPTAGVAGGPGRWHGFTLIELLVGLVIISALLGAVVLAFPRSGERRTELAAERAETLLRLACERAELTGRDIGIAVGERRLAFGPFRAGRWEPIADSPAEALRPRVLEEIVTLVLRVDGRPAAPAEGDGARPQLACLAGGELMPFELEVRGPANQAWRLRGDSAGGLQRERIDG